MSSQTDVHHDAQHADDGEVHAHISSVPFYVAVFVGLLILTVATVGQSYVDLGKANLIFVILIATMKASLVVTFFMHLKWDNKFNALIFLSTIFFIGVFFAYTLNDTGKLILTTIGCACMFLVIKFFEYKHKFEGGLLPGRFYHPHAEHLAANSPALPDNTGTFFSIYFMMTGVHGIHVQIGRAHV